LGAALGDGSALGGRGVVGHFILVALWRRASFFAVGLRRNLNSRGIIAESFAVRCGCGWESMRVASCRDGRTVRSSGQNGAARMYLFMSEQGERADIARGVNRVLVQRFR
jgi:hypothetical protein